MLCWPNIMQNFFFVLYALLVHFLFFFHVLNLLFGRIQLSYNDLYACEGKTLFENIKQFPALKTEHCTSMYENKGSLTYRQAQ